VGRDSTVRFSITYYVDDATITNSIPGFAKTVKECLYLGMLRL